MRERRAVAILLKRFICSATERWESAHVADQRNAVESMRTE